MFANRKFHPRPQDHKNAKHQQLEKPTKCKVPESYRKKVADGSEIPLINDTTKYHLKRDYKSLKNFITKMNELCVTNNHEYGCYHCLSGTHHSNDDSSIKPTQ